MQISLQLLAIVPLLLESVSGAASQSCRTELGTKSIKNVPTAWSTTTKKPATKTLLAEQKTVTTYKGFVSTKTKTVTSTKVVTNKAITDTFSSTATSFEVSTITVPATVTETETSTSTEQSVSTTVIPTAAGFRMIQDTINSEDLLGPRGLDLGHPHGDVDRRASKTVKKDGGVQAFVYPNRVDCTKTMNNKVTKTSWKTLAPATETYAYWSKTSTKTKTQWRTSTKIPANVPTTIVDTSTSSVTTYTTTFETQTEQTSTTTTEVLPGPTVYDSCAQGNYFGPNFFASGQNYFAVNVANNGPGVASDFKTVADGATTATECCNACQRFANCETFLFRARNKNCFLLYHEGGVCQGQSRHPNFILSRQGVDTGAGYVVGNGNCGYTYSGNSDGSVFPVNNFP